jgi:hypothetical protein
MMNSNSNSISISRRSICFVGLLLLALMSSNGYMTLSEASVASAPTYYDVTGNSASSGANSNNNNNDNAAATDENSDSKMSYGSKIAEGRKRRNKIKGALKRRHLTASGVEEINDNDNDEEGEEMEHLLRYLQFSTPVSTIVL